MSIFRDVINEFAEVKGVQPLYFNIRKCEKSIVRYFLEIISASIDKGKSSKYI